MLPCSDKTESVGDGGEALPGAHGFLVSLFITFPHVGFEGKNGGIPGSSGCSGSLLLPPSFVSELSRLCCGHSCSGHRPEENMQTGTSAMGLLPKGSMGKMHFQISEAPSGG